MRPVIVWFRNNLRLRDNPALAEASQTGRPVIPVYIFDETCHGAWPPGAASRWWLHHSLLSLAEALREKGLPLVIRRGCTLDILRDLAETHDAEAVYAPRAFAPHERELEAALRRDIHVQWRLVWSECLIPPAQFLNRSGDPYRIFTPFWRELQKQLILPPLRRIKDLRPPSQMPAVGSVASLGFLPRAGWAEGFEAQWQPGEPGARARLKTICSGRLNRYPDARDIPSEEGTSKLSPHLHFGELSVREVIARVGKAQSEGNVTDAAAQAFVRQLAWREFANYLLWHFPHTTDQPLRQEYASFPWQTSRVALRRWQKGLTGYPIVDAGMRELWSTGWMHNRVRMIAASFLVKDLLLPWQEGARWFWDTLVDADLANNTMGWQWVSGCGADAAPYFRIFNPVLQAKRFDPEGEYVRRWVPELRHLETPLLFEPWKAPAEALRAGGVELGVNYPKPIVDHAEAKDRALAAYAAIKRS